ncbi:MAG: ABC transporter ATP-binding protein [Anaerolineae bacterium]
MGGLPEHWPTLPDGTDTPTMPLDDVIRTVHLSKRFGSLVALQDLDLRVGRGEIYGFLGPNGAGKTTTMLLLLGLLRPSAGSVHLFGQPIRPGDAAIRCRVGVVPEQPYLYPHMTAQEYLALFADLYDVPRRQDQIAQLLNAVDLFDRRHSRLREFSHGMQQKIGLARALLHDPELLLLDEPTSGLDPSSAKQVRDLLLDLKQRGKTILISSHILSEVERTADRVGILVKGRLQAQDTVEHLIQGVQSDTIVEIELLTAVPHLSERLRALPFVRKVEVQGAVLTISLSPTEGKELHARLFAAITAGDGTIVQMTSRKGTLEDAFLAITETGALDWVREVGTHA